MKAPKPIRLTTPFARIEAHKTSFGHWHVSAELLVGSRRGQRWETRARTKKDAHEIVSDYARWAAAPPDHVVAGDQA